MNAVFQDFTAWCCVKFILRLKLSQSLDKYRMNERMSECVKSLNLDVFTNCNDWEELLWEKSTPGPVNQWLIPGNHSTLFRNDPDRLYLLLQCLVTCGKGHKHRQVWCQFGEDRLNDRICDSETKPASMQTCQQPECASWQAGPWGQVFWMIKFLTTFFPSYLERACRGTFQRPGFNHHGMWHALHLRGAKWWKLCNHFAPLLRVATWPPGADYSFSRPTCMSSPLG